MRDKLPLVHFSLILAECFGNHWEYLGLPKTEQQYNVGAVIDMLCDFAMECEDRELLDGLTYRFFSPGSFGYTGVSLDKISADRLVARATVPSLRLCFYYGQWLLANSNSYEKSVEYLQLALKLFDTVPNVCGIKKTDIFKELYVSYAKLGLEKEAKEAILAARDDHPFDYCDFLLDKEKDVAAAVSWISKIYCWESMRKVGIFENAIR